MAKLVVNLMGGTEILYGDRRLNKILSNKAIGLISLLLMNWGKKTRREKIVAYMWADSDEESARYNLRYNLWNIKKVIPTDQNGQKFILADRDSCQINPKFDFESDILKIAKANLGIKASTEVELSEYLKLYRGDFLEDFYLKNCDDFNERVMTERIEYQNKHVDLLKLMAEMYGEQKNYKDCIFILNELNRIEPYDEDIALKLMKVFVDWGKRGEAISIYKKIEASLRNNLNISPCPDLKKLYHRLLEEIKDAPEEEQANRKIKKQLVEIDVMCMGNIDYFCLSEILREIIVKVEKRYIYGFNKCYLEDLNFIQLEICLGYEKLYSEKCKVHSSLPTVRVADAFFNFIRYVSEVCKLQIRIAHSADMDKISENILTYLLHLKIEDLTIMYVKND